MKQKHSRGTVKGMNDRRKSFLKKEERNHNGIMFADIMRVFEVYHRKKKCKSVDDVISLMGFLPNYHVHLHLENIIFFKKAPDIEFALGNIAILLIVF